MIKIGIKIESTQDIPIPQFNNMEVKITDNEEYIIGEYYLIRYFYPDSKYTLYYVSKFTKSGFNNFDLYLVSTNEVYEDFDILIPEEIEQ